MKMTWEFKSGHHCTEKKNMHHCLWQVCCHSRHIYIIIYVYICIYIYTRLYYGNSLVYTFLEILGHNLKATLTAATKWQVAAGSHCQHKLQLRCSPPWLEGCGQEEQQRNHYNYCSMHWMGWVSNKANVPYPCLLYLFGRPAPPHSYDMGCSITTNQRLLCLGRL